MIIEFTDITKQYGQKRAVDHINLSLNNGVCALLGANGSGKTTLMRMLADVLRPTEGKISLDGRDIRMQGASYRNLLGYLPQNFGYYRDFRSMDFLLYMCALKGIDGKLAKERSTELLKYVDLYDQRNKKIKTFSGGMRQRLGIAQALLNEPSILILDEPTAGLDPKERIRFRNMMNEVSKNKIIIYATHIVSDISYIADRVLIMKLGKIAADAPPEQLLRSMEGKVWLLDIARDRLPALQQNYTVGSITPTESDRVRARIVSDVCPDNGIPAAAELEDVYLYHFGEVSVHDGNDKV